MTDFSPGALCTFMLSSTAQLLAERGNAASRRRYSSFAATTLVLVIRDFCDMTLVCVDGHVGWVYKCWIAEAKDVR